MINLSLTSGIFSKTMWYSICLPQRFAMVSTCALFPSLRNSRPTNTSTFPKSVKLATSHTQIRRSGSPSRSPTVDQTITFWKALSHVRNILAVVKIGKCTTKHYVYNWKHKIAQNQGEESTPDLYTLTDLNILCMTKKSIPLLNMDQCNLNKDK